MLLPPPSPSQQCLVDSAGLLEDHRTDNLAEMLKRLYAYCRKKETQASQSTGVEPTAAYRPDPHDRFLWAALATACTRRVMVTTGEHGRAGQGAGRHSDPATPVGG